MERNEAYIIALVASAVAVIIAVALMVPYITGTDTGSELTVSAKMPSSGKAPLGDEGMPSAKDGDVAPPDGGGGRMPGDLPEMDSEQAAVMPGMIAPERCRHHRCRGGTRGGRYGHGHRLHRGVCAGEAGRPRQVPGG
ncbi:MAG TPA: hypothetical protein ENN44_05380 [Methanoculleus sp.]|nr:hypothetical protein [Methanoculleus sp.]